MKPGMLETLQQTELKSVLWKLLIPPQKVIGCWSQSSLWISSHCVGYPKYNPSIVWGYVKHGRPEWNIFMHSIWFFQHQFLFKNWRKVCFKYNPSIRYMWWSWILAAWYSEGVQASSNGKQENCQLSLKCGQLAIIPTKKSEKHELKTWQPT